jgi:plastocyanin
VSHVRLLFVASLALAGLAVPGSVGAHVAVTQPLLATVGSPTSPDAFEISLTDSTGAKVTHVDPGQYTINVHDYSTLHDFHLTGPGVDQATTIETASTATWNVSFTDGTYRYSCDAHPTSMRGSFTSGTVVAPPPVKKLVAQVGPKRTISLKTASGARVKSLTAGKYKLTVKDLTKADNFHLIAAGVNRKTGVAFRGTATWTVTFHVGAGKYRSDAHSALHGGFTVNGTG